MRRTTARLSSLLLVACIVALGCGGGVATDTTPVTPPPTPIIALSVDSVLATVTAGAAAVASDVDISAGSSIALTGITVADEGAAAPAWMTYTLSALSAPARLHVVANPGALPPGSYSTTLKVSAAGAQPRTVRITLAVKAHPRLVLGKTTLAFAGDVGGVVAPQTIDVSSAGDAIGGLGISGVECGQGNAVWITPSLAAAGAPTSLNVSVQGASLTAGTYSCSFVVSTAQPLVDDASIVVSVTLTLRFVPHIAVSRDSVTLTAPAGTSATGTVAITNDGTGVLDNLSLGAISYGAGATSWLTTRLDRSTTRFVPVNLSLDASAVSLAEGTYVATVPVLSGAVGVANSPRLVKVVLIVTPPAPVLIATPAIVAFSKQFGTPATSVAIVRISSSGPTFHSMAFGGVFDPGFPDPWMSAFLGCPGIPGSGVFDTPCTLEIRFTPVQSKPVGTYEVTVPVRSWDANVYVNVLVRLVITP